MRIIPLFLIVCSLFTAASAAEPKAGRVLFIGIDGCRFDALESARAPHLDGLIAEGCHSRRTLILGSRYRDSDTVSGPGWSSLLTGVWADKHGVNNNRFLLPKLDKYPHFFHHVKSQRPDAKTVSISSWPPIKKYIVSDADVNVQTSDAERYVPGDADSAAQAVAALRGDDPTAMFVYFGQVDEHGHSFGFHPSVPEYISAIERVDTLVGQLLEALRSRPKYTAENWLVLVSSDHGGVGKDHGKGHKVPEILNSFFIVSGAAAARGEIADPVYLVDVPVTALTHLGIRPDPAWQLDDRAVGLRTKQP